MKATENILRSLFISLFPLTALVALIYAILHYVENGFSWQMLGIGITASAVVILFAGLFIKPRARTDANLKLYTLAVACGLVLSFMAPMVFERFNSKHISVSLLLGLGWVLYLKWYSIFKDRENGILKVGKPLIEFELENSEKQAISSTSFLGKPSIFIFYRGNWCPLCMAQIKEIAGQYKELQNLGVRTVLISPQPHGHTKKLAGTFQLNFHFLVDSKNKVARKLGILAENGIPAGFQVLGYDSDTVMPTIVITNKEGEIIFADLTDNYRVRPEPEVFLKIIRETLA